MRALTAGCVSLSAAAARRKPPNVPDRQEGLDLRDFHQRSHSGIYLSDKDILYRI